MVLGFKGRNVAVQGLLTLLRWYACPLSMLDVSFQSSSVYSFPFLGGAAYSPWTAAIAHSPCSCHRI